MPLAFPKPGPRPRKAKKPIQRRTRPSRVRKTAKAAAGRKADLAWAKAVRESGPCAALGVEFSWEFLTIVHVTEKCNWITAAHIVSRRYVATRTDRRNGLPLCFNAHLFFTANPKAWEAFAIKKLGQKAYDRLKAKAMAGVKGAV